MRIRCQFCPAEYEVEPSQIPVEGLPVRCVRCEGVFVVSAPAATAASAWQAEVPELDPELDRLLAEPPGLGGIGAEGEPTRISGAPSHGGAPWSSPAAPWAPGGAEPWSAPASTAGGDPWSGSAAPAGGDPWTTAAAPGRGSDPWEVPASGGRPDPWAPPSTGGGGDPWAAPAAHGDDPWLPPAAPIPSDPWAPPPAPAAPQPWAPPAAPTWVPPPVEPRGARGPAGESSDRPTSERSRGAPAVPEAHLPVVVSSAPAAPRGSAPAASSGSSSAAMAGGPGARTGLDYFDLFGSEASQVGPRVDLVQYAIRRADGTVLGQYDQVTVRAHLQIGKLSSVDQVSADGGMTWQYLSAMPEFSDLTVVGPGPLSAAGELARVEPIPGGGWASGALVATSAGAPQAPLGGGLEHRGAATPQAVGPWGPVGGGAHLPGVVGPAGAMASASTAESQRLATTGPAGGLAGAAPSTGLATPGPGPSVPRAVPEKPAERPAWLAPAINTAEGKASMAFHRGQRRRRLALIVALGLLFCGGAAFLLLWEPAFEGEDAIKKRITLDEGTVAKYRAQSRALLQVGTYRAYAEARQKLLSVLRADPSDRVSRALYLQAMLYLLRDFGQLGVEKEVEAVRKELSKGADSGVEFRKAKISYALWKRDVADAKRNLELLLAADPDDREARFLSGLALSTPAEAPQAARLFDGLIALDARNAKYLRAKADALLPGDRDAGIAVLRQLLTVSPENPGAALRLAELYLEAGRREDGRRLLVWLIDPRTAARKEASPDELARAQSLLGTMAFEDRDVDAARRYLDAALKSASSDAERVRALVALGEVLIDLRDFKGAIQRLELAQRSLPRAAEVLSHLSVAYARDGQSKKARDAVMTGRKVLLERKVEELPPPERSEHQLQDARLRLASAVVNETDEIPRQVEAIEDYRAALALTGKVQGEVAAKLGLETRVRLAGLLRRQKNLNGAQVELAEALKYSPRSPAVHNGLGEVLADQGQAARAEEAFRKALELDPRYTRARFNLASMLSDAGRLSEALELLKAIEKAEATYPGLYLATAIAYQRQKLFKEAIGAFERAIQASPDDARVFLRIGIAYFEFGGEESLRKAREYLDRAIEKNRLLNQAYYHRGRVLMALGKPEIALDDYKTASEREPDNGLYRVHFGAAFEKMGSYRDAFFQYTRAIELLRDQKNEVDIAVALYRRGRLRLERDEGPAALQDLEEALRYDASNTEVLVLLGDSLSQARKHAQAVVRYRAALERGAKVKGLWFKLGKSLLEVGQRPEAMKAMQSAAAEAPGDCYPHYYIGYLYKDFKQEGLAIRSLERFLSQCASASEKKDVLRDLQDMRQRGGAGAK